LDGRDADKRICVFFDACFFIQSLVACSFAECPLLAPNLAVSPAIPTADDA
jgi:hypothetical protein